MTRPASPSVLIVDGDIISRHAIADYLRHCGYSVVEAQSAIQSISKEIKFREELQSISSRKIKLAERKSYSFSVVLSLL